MNKKDLETKWLHLAYSEKKEGQINEDRAFVGSKGIGRFSCDSLGSFLTITTKKKDELLEHTLTVNWKDFENVLEKRFETIDVKYTSTIVPNENRDKSYTVLKIENLRHQNWDSGSIKKVIESLQRLKNPFRDADGFDIYCGENIVSNYKKLSEIPDEFLIKSSIAEVLKNKSITIEVQINDLIKVDLFDRGKHIYTIQKTNETVLKNSKIFMAVNYLTTSAKSTFTRRMKIEPVNYGNIFIYRNDFRVSPYGEKDYDLFGLNIRKGQGYARNISARELIGHIDITDSTGVFKETSSRNNGFIENIYLDALQNVYMEYAHKPLERYVHLIKWGEDSDNKQELFLNSAELDETEKFKKGLTSKIFGAFELIYFAKDVSFEDNNPSKQLEKIAATLPDEQQKKTATVIKQVSTLIKDNQEKEQALSSKQQTIASLELQNKNISARRPESSFGEQLSHHFPAMADKLSNSVKELNNLNLELTAEQHKVFYGALRKIRRTELELRAFKNLLLNTNIDLRSPQRLNWQDIAERFIKDKRGSSSNKSLKLNCSAQDETVQKNWGIRSNAIEVMMMFENFYRNAEEHGATYLEIFFDQNKLIVSSDSTPIADANLEKIFELGFSTKANGTGIGLNQIKEFLKRSNLTIKANNFNNSVRFDICKKDEVCV
jgi:signal transduction histidine kinase